MLVYLMCKFLLYAECTFNNLKCTMKEERLLWNLKNIIIQFIGIITLTGKVKICQVDKEDV